MSMEGSRYFVKAVRNVFETMLQTRVIDGSEQQEKPDDIKQDIAAAVTYQGEISGTCYLCFPDVTAKQITKKFLGEEMPLNHPDTEDALGELINMVAGNAKAKFKTEGTNLSCPKITKGDMASQMKLFVPYESELGSFYLGLNDN